MAVNHTYDRSFYLAELEAKQRSAKTVVPILKELVCCDRVVDVGCGLGTWLAVFRELGSTRIFGLDSPQVDTSLLAIPAGSFQTVDLAHPFQTEDRFDIALCLEVAEHLPRASAPALIESLIRLAPAILFSAAIPLQQGTHHFNEQWPWFWRAIFARHGYRQVDLVRPRIWMNPEVLWWYRQNILLYVSAELASQNTKLREAAASTDDMCLLHSSILYRYSSLSAVLRNLPRMFLRSIRSRLE